MSTVRTSAASLRAVAQPQTPAAPAAPSRMSASAAKPEVPGSWATAAPSASRLAQREQGTEQARAALATFSAQGQVLLNGIARQGHDEVLDPLTALVSGVTGKKDAVRLRVADAARALEYERVALGSVVADIRDGKLTPPDLGQSSWSQVDLVQVAQQRLSSPGFDVKAAAKLLESDVDWAKVPMSIPGPDARPTAKLSVAELDRWGQRVKSSTHWLSESGTAKNLKYWRGLPVVKALHRNVRDVSVAPTGQRDQAAQLASLRTGLAMATGGALAPVLEPSMLAAAARAAGLTPSADLKATCRELQAALSKGQLSSLSSTERAGLEKLIGPANKPGEALAKRLSSEHWSSFLRTMPQFIVETAVATAATTATGGAVAGLGSVGLAASGMATGVALEVLLRGEQPSLKSLASGAVMGMAGNAVGKVVNNLAGTALAGVAQSGLAGSIAVSLAGHGLNTAASVSMQHFVASVKDGVPFTENLAEDLLRSLVASATGSAVASAMAPRLDAVQRLVAEGQGGPPEARDATAKAVREARKARTAFSEKARAVEDLASRLALAPPEAEARALGKKYLKATEELKVAGATLGDAVSAVEVAAARLPRDQSSAVLNATKAWEAQVQGVMKDVAVSRATTAPAATVGIGKPVSHTKIVDSLIRADQARLADLKAGTTKAAMLVVPEDGTSKVKAVHMAALGADTTGMEFPLEMARVGKREGFDVVLRVPAGEEKRIAKAFANEKLSNVKLIPVKDSAELDFWSEDQGELHTDGSVSVPRSLFGGGAIQGPELDKVLTAARLERMHPGKKVDLSTPEAVAAARSKFPEVAYSGVGAVAERGGQRAIAAIALGEKKGLRVSNSYIEGGNALVGRRAKGEAFAVVGADSLAVSKAALSKELGRPVTDAEVRRLIAQDYGVAPKELVVVEQPGDFHIDMHMSLLPGGKAIVNDAMQVFELQKKWMAEDHARAKPKPPPPGASAAVREQYANDKALWDIRNESLPGEIKELGKAARRAAASEERMVRDLKKGGVEVNRVPGVFERTQSLPMMNFMNFEHGQNAKGEHFIVSLGGDSRAQQIIASKLEAITGKVNLHFLNPALTEATLSAQGGVSCRAKLESAP
jgi:hypothetical protein